MGNALGEAMGRLRPVGLRLAVASVKVDLTDDTPPLMVGDQVTVTVTARVVSATVSEKFDRKSREFIGSLTYTAAAQVEEAEVTGHKSRAELEREWAERVGS